MPPRQKSATTKKAVSKAAPVMEDDSASTVSESVCTTARSEVSTAMDTSRSEVSSVSASTSVAPAPPKKTRKRKTKESEETDTAVSVPVAAAGKTKKKKQKIHKKRGPSSYILFTKQYRTEHSNLSNLSLGDMSKACGEAWKNISDTEKDKYRQEAERIRTELRANDPPPPPKKPMSSYLAFAMVSRKQIIAEDPSLKLGDVSKKCGELWKKLTDEERAEWKKKASNASVALVQ